MPLLGPLPRGFRDSSRPEEGRGYDSMRVLVVLKVRECAKSFVSGSPETSKSRVNRGPYNGHEWETRKRNDALRQVDEVPRVLLDGGRVWVEDTQHE